MTDLAAAGTCCAFTYGNAFSGCIGATDLASAAGCCPSDFLLRHSIQTTGKNTTSYDCVSFRSQADCAAYSWSGMTPLWVEAPNCPHTTSSTVVDDGGGDDDDDDGGGATELVMSGGLVAIGLTFTGISIAAIANALQEQCALGPTIVYEAGTTHPYYITPNLCTIGTKTFSSDKTVRDASPRKVCRKFCEAASEKGKLALKHVQGLTCYCKRR